MTANGDLTRPVQNFYLLEISYRDKLWKKSDFTKPETVALKVDVTLSTLKFKNLFMKFRILLTIAFPPVLKLNVVGQ